MVALRIFSNERDRPDLPGPFSNSVMLIGLVAALLGAMPICCEADEAPTVSNSVSPRALPASVAQPVVVNVATGAELQRELHRHAGSNRTVRLAKPVVLTCVVQEELIEGEQSRHALLVPQGVRLDLNGATLALDLRSNSYGVRLSSDSAISNGTVKVVRSEGKGSQSCWHSGISVGAAYGDGGTPQQPSYFSKVSHWSIERMTIDQPFAAAAIQLMSEACHGVIRDIHILDSDKALLGIGLDWGSVGPITTEDAELPRMRRLWEQGEIYSTHPHDILIEQIRIGKLLRNQDPNDSGVRMSACHNVTVRNVQIDTAATALMIVGGDLGYEYAQPDQRKLAHQGYVIENVRIGSALRFGLVMNGLADNVWRSQRSAGYKAVVDPCHPGLEKLVIRDVTLRAAGKLRSQGIYAVALSGAQFERINISGFTLGVHVEDWVRGMLFQNCQIQGNDRDTLVEGATEPAAGVVFDPKR